MRFSLFRLGSLCAVALGLYVPDALAQEGLVKISVETVPPGANVYVDDKGAGIQCQSGPGCKLRLKKGTHRLILELDGFKTSEQTLNVSSAQRYSFKLQTAPATIELLTLATNPSGRGAEVYVDGKLAGSVPGSVEVASGKHMLEIKRAGFLALTEAIEVKGGESRPVYVALSAVTKESPTTGALMVSAAVPSEVLVDDQPRGPVPVLVASLAPGDHVVDIVPQAPGLLPWRRNVRVNAGEQARAYGTFQPAPEQPQPQMLPPQEHTVPVAIVPKNPKFSYVVTMGMAQSCTTPCTLQVPPGPSAIAVNGPGTKSFRRQIMIPNAPAQVAVQHFTLSRVISGPILTVLGLGALGGGSVLVTASSDPITLSAGGLALLHGVAFTAAGIGELARIKTNRADVQGLGPVAQSAAPRARFLGASVAPLPDRTGAIAVAAFGM